MQVGTFDLGGGSNHKADAPPTHEELVLMAESKRDVLLSGAAAKIVPLQDAVDLSDATQDEISVLRAWKQYRVLLNRVDVSNVPSGLNSRHEEKPGRPGYND